LNVAAAVEVNPADAEHLGLADDSRARVTGKAGASIELAVRVTARVPKGVVFVPGFDSAAPAVRLLARDRDAVPGVRVEAL
jgi:predicted molibdopterin-dependent oxidoreductase YjgC